MNMRNSWEDYYLDLAERLSESSTCARRQVGAVIVKYDKILSTGYNASSIKCTKEDCIREQLKVKSGEREELCKAIHAEQMALTNAVKNGIAVDGATLYCTHRPCVTCQKLLLNAGIKKVKYRESYPQAV